MRRLPRLAFVMLAAVASCAAPGTTPSGSVRPDDPRLKSASRHDEAGWIAVHLEGAPDVVGFQYGYLVANEIDDALVTFRQYLPVATHRDWSFFRKTADDFFWPKLTAEEKQEIDGMVAGGHAHGKRFDRSDLVALNGWMEIAFYYIPKIDKRDNAAPANCSAFVATGSYTRDGGIVMGHNAWVDYAIGERWNLVLDIVPAKGHRMFMDSFPGFIHSGDDFAVNDAGILVTETTITQFKGFDPAGVPEFARARRAIQYAGTIDEWAKIMREGNNGGYANSWLVGDRKTGEIARLELGLKNTPLGRTTDGFFIGSNFPDDAKLRTEETTFNADDPNNSANARRKRWEQIMEENRGRIDAEIGKRFLSDHVDSRSGKTEPSARTLCGHVELDPLGAPEWEWAPFYPGGACQSKVMDSRLAGEMSFWACMGHACGQFFRAEPFLAEHADFAWQKPFLRDLPSGRWTLFRSAGPAKNL